MKKLYLDIDGVLLSKRNIKATDGAEEFIDYILEHYDCYWLTTHCRDGNTFSVIQYLSQYYPYTTIRKVSGIKPLMWNTLKTEAIDFHSDFYWIDDYVFEAEKKILEKHGCCNSLILVDQMNPNELKQIVQKLKME